MDTNPISGGGCPAAARQAEETRAALRANWTAKLSQLAEQRDKILFSELFRYFAPRVKAWLVRLGLSDAVADEIAQEAMLMVWRKAHLFDARKASASTWIFTLARNLFIDLKRRERHTFVPLLDDDPSLTAPGKETELVLSQHMLTLLEKLPSAQAQVVYMSYYEGRSHSEIARRLGIPLGSVKSRMRLAFSKLRGRLSHNAEDSISSD
ncbi:MAG: sigma-70 family RNA polymerase sigma factor [Marinobacterium sp.]|nr:sigma-70 family RNA polymerase sigma factor [Marinobacterium sp.]